MNKIKLIDTAPADFIALYGDLSPDSRVGVVTGQFKVFVPEGKEVFYLWVDIHHW